MKIMIPSMAVGIAVAGLFAASLTAAHIRLAIGLIAGIFVLRHWLGTHFERLAPQPGVVTGVLFGIVGGFTTMLANAGGPAWQMHLLPQRLDKLTYVGTFTMLFAASNLMKIPAYGALGLGFVIAFAAQGAGHVLWPFVGAASRLLFAAGGGWLAVSYFGGGMATLATMVSVSLVSYAAICTAAMLFGGIWKVEIP